MVSRREILIGAAAASASVFLPASVFSATVSASHLRFVHFSDIHIQPELGAEAGVALAVKKLLALRPRPEFVITGGDHVMDLLNVSHERADVQFKLLEEALKPLEMPVYSVIGNHDLFGWGNKSIDSSDASYGKKMIEERVLKAPAYRSFDHAGYHFVLLDSVQPSEKTNWHGAIDDEQLTWLANDLDKAAMTPTVVVSHVPVMTLANQYIDSTTAAATDTLLLANGKEVKEILQKHHVLGVMQGHTHVVENCEYLGTQYITGGAVCGDWWKGWRLGVHPEGFMVVDLGPNGLKSTYTPYGWKAQTA